MEIHVVKRDEGVGEVDLCRGQFADGVERGIAVGDGAGDRRGDLVRRRLKRGDGDDGIELGGGLLKIRERRGFGFGNGGE